MTVRHPSRRRSVIAIAILAAVLAAMLVVILRARGGGEPVPQPTLPPTPLAATPTLLVQLRDDDLDNVDNVFMALDVPAASGSEMYLSPSLVVDLVGAWDERLARTGVRPISQAPPLVAAQTGWRVDGAFVLDRLAYAGLVDSVGGVEVTLEQPLVVVDRFGTVTTTIEAGTRVLNGPEAAVYSMYLAPGESEAARIARFQQTWSQVVEALPAEPERIRAVFGSLGALARSTQPVAVLADFFAAAGDARRAGAWRESVLPTRPAPMGPTVVEWIEPGPAQLQSAILFPAAVPPLVDPPLRVRVYQAGAPPSELERARRAITDDGGVFVWSGAVPAQAESTIAVSAPELVAGTAELARALGIPPARVTVNPLATPGAPVSVRMAPALKPTPSAMPSPGASGGAAAPTATTPAAAPPAAG